MSGDAKALAVTDFDHDGWPDFFVTRNNGSTLAFRNKGARGRHSLRVELRASGVKAITICPGYIATPMTSQNPYRMPFILSAETAARRIARVIDRGRTFAIIPWQMAIIARILRVLPNWLYDRLFGHAPRKPRRPRP